MPEVETSDVPSGFAIPVPLALDFGAGKVRYTFLMLDEPRKTFHLIVPSASVKVTLDPGAAVLAHVVQIK